MKAYAPVVAAAAAAAAVALTAVVSAPLVAATDAATAAAAAATGRSTGSAVVFKAPLSGAAEVPPVESAAAGVVLALLSDAVHLSVAWSFSGLPTPVDLGVGIHLHEAPAGANGPILVPLTDDAMLTAGGTGGCGWAKVALNASQAEALVAGNLYLNVHTEGNPGGALRGQLRQAVSAAIEAAGPAAAGADLPEVTAPAADVDDDGGVAVGATDGPSVGGDEPAGFFPSAEEPDASPAPAAADGGDEDAGFEGNDEGDDFGGGAPDGGADGGDGLDDDAVAGGGNLAGGQTAPPVAADGGDDDDNDDDDDDDDTAAPTVSPTVAADAEGADAGGAAGGDGASGPYPDADAAPTPYVVRVERA
ncbi:hypothetical protein I4F81_011366 [Pyropia yezoensis]|uniref:Uncharacterized protein n=1 Tax=Pyropia yezoensis TaxID=2788 RepID=A0ACC3CG23_PYRYE|nr:hypothetical protein I4F81_011366 [Neopyropia yezoensis]